MPWILITLLLFFLLINPSVALAVGFPPFPNTTNNIHIGQVFNYRITNPDDELGKVDIVWGSGYANQPTGMYNTRYIPFDRVPTYNPDDSLSTHDLVWFQTNHPDWVEYQCDGVTPAYEYGSQNVPLDITNPDVLDYIFQNYLSPAITSGYQGIAFDNVNLDNAPGRRCGIYQNSVWAQQFTGLAHDPAYITSVINWGNWMQTQLHAINAASAMNFSYDFTEPTNSDLLLQTLDIQLDERGFTNFGAGTGYITDNNWLTVVQKLQYLNTLGKGFFTVNEKLIPFAQISNEDKNWVIGSYLMAKGTNSFMSINGDQEYGMILYTPEYSAQIGSPTNSMYQNQGVYRRDFENGIALVNPSSTQSFTVTVPLDQYQDLYGTIVNTTTMGPHTGLVLLKLPPDTLAPTVSITSPTNNSQVRRNTTVTIQATASDNRSVTKVEFYVNNVLKCTDTTSSYSCNFLIPNKKNVTYTLIAKAYDAAGNITTSSPIRVTSI